ncbi:MAG: hypothetical protein AB1767_07945 [Bacillota bacterium]
MLEFEPHWVIDLHEALTFERVQPGGLGQTIIYPAGSESLERTQSCLPLLIAYFSCLLLSASCFLNGVLAVEVNILYALLQNLLSTNRMAEPSLPREGYPASLEARVVSVKGELALLRWDGGTFTALLNAPVVPGETVLLEYLGLKQERCHYRILSRYTSAAAGESSSRDNQAPLIFGLILGFDGDHPAPALLRYHPRNMRPENLTGDNDPILELFVETENIGLVAVRFTQKKGRLGCHFFVETAGAGEALEREARRIAGAAGTPVDGTVLLRWSVSDLRREAETIIQNSRHAVNTRA